MATSSSKVTKEDMDRFRGELRAAKEKFFKKSIKYYIILSACAIVILTFLSAYFGLMRFNINGGGFKVYLVVVLILISLPAFSLSNTNASNRTFHCPITMV